MRLDKLLKRSSICMIITSHITILSQIICLCTPKQIINSLILDSLLISRNRMHSNITHLHRRLLENKLKLKISKKIGNNATNNMLHLNSSNSSSASDQEMLPMKRPVMSLLQESHSLSQYSTNYRFVAKRCRQINDINIFLKKTMINSGRNSAQCLQSLICKRIPIQLNLKIYSIKCYAPILKTEQLLNKYLNIPGSNIEKEFKKKQTFDCCSLTIKCQESDQSS